MKILGALLGAILAPVILIALVIAVSPRISGDNWDWVTPMLTIIAAVAACIGGAIAGALIADALQGGDTRRAGILLVLALVLVAAFPAWLANLWYGPQPVAKPVTVSQRDKWAEDRLAFFKQYGFSEGPGLSLAWQLRTCLRTGDCRYEQWRSYAKGEDSVGAHVQAYRLEDDGWRWDTIEGPPRRFIVFADPRLKREGPVFEVGPYDIHRRDTRDAPAYSTDSSLAALLGLHDCLARFAQVSRASGYWDGRPDTLGAVIAEKWSPPEGCPLLGLYTEHEQPHQPWEFEVRSGNAIHSRFQITPDTEIPDMPFRFAFMFNGRGFMREPNGNWHVRPGGIPYNGDPPPPRCLFDLSVACDAPPM